MSAATEAKIVGRTPYLEFVKKNARHVLVKMLASMDNHFIDAIRCMHSPTYHGRFDELRSGTYYSKQLNHIAGLAAPISLLI
jgi:hypothetical protein